MATAIDLESQEKLDALKNFWDKWGNLIVAVAVVLIGSFAAWTGYQSWMKSQSEKSSVIFEQLETAVKAKDLGKVESSLNDIKSKHPKTLYAQQAGLVAAKAFYEGDRAAAARDALDWVVAQKDRYGYQSLARLRLASLWMEEKNYDKALATIGSGVEQEFEPMAQDLRGDILVAQNKPDQAQAEYIKAYKAMELTNPLRGVVSVKLAAVGFDATTLDPKKEEAAQDSAAAAPAAKE